MFQQKLNISYVAFRLNREKLTLIRFCVKSETAGLCIIKLKILFFHPMLILNKKKERLFVITRINVYDKKNLERFL